MAKRKKDKILKPKLG